MKNILGLCGLPLCTLIILICVSVFLTGCDTIKGEFTSPVGTTDAPPITTQLNAAAPIVSAVAPQPWGTLVAMIMNLLATGAATMATFHARAAANSAASTATTVKENQAAQNN